MSLRIEVGTEAPCYYSYRAADRCSSAQLDSVRLSQDAASDQTWEGEWQGTAHTSHAGCSPQHTEVLQLDSVRVSRDAASVDVWQDACDCTSQGLPMPHTQAAQTHMLKCSGDRQLDSVRVSRDAGSDDVWEDAHTSLPATPEERDRPSTPGHEARSSPRAELAKSMGRGVPALQPFNMFVGQVRSTQSLCVTQ